MKSYKKIPMGVTVKSNAINNKNVDFTCVNVNNFTVVVKDVFVLFLCFLKTIHHNTLLRITSS